MAEMKGFYRQKKKNAGGGIKASSSSKTKSKQHAAAAAALALGSDPRNGSLDLHDDDGDDPEVLKQFDMNMAYGPCVGMSRMARWERASSLGLNPPSEVHQLLLVAASSSASSDKTKKARVVRSGSLWDGRV